MKESEVKIKLQEKINIRKKIFCPIIKGMCKINCESFVKPEIYKITDDINSYQVRGGYCDASCLHSVGD